MQYTSSVILGKKDPSLLGIHVFTEKFSKYMYFLIESVNTRIY